jgi:2-iminobutanoate/2-iminopropanoate deaminase
MKTDGAKTHSSGVVGPNGRPLPFSSAIEVDDLVYLSGQLALRGGKVDGDIGQQTDLIFDNIETVLASAGLTLDSVVKASIWITDPADFAAFNAAYAARFTAPYPTRSCVVSQLVIPGARVEIEVVASRRHHRT